MLNWSLEAMLARVNVLSIVSSSVERFYIASMRGSSNSRNNLDRSRGDCRVESAVMVL